MSRLREAPCAIRQAPSTRSHSTRSNRAPTASPSRPTACRYSASALPHVFLPILPWTVGGLRSRLRCPSPSAAASRTAHLADDDRLYLRLFRTRGRRLFTDEHAQRNHPLRDRRESGSQAWRAEQP